MDGEGKFAPHLIEEVYNLEDALVVAGFLHSFVRHADGTANRGFELWQSMSKRSSGLIQRFIVMLLRVFRILNIDTGTSLEHNTRMIYGYTSENGYSICRKSNWRISHIS